MDPAKIDENVDFFKREVVPQIKASPGFRALRNMINRQTGEGMVGTVWTDNASMEAAAEAAEARRQQAAQQRVTFGEQSRREIVFADMP
jgi:heme-degrading monooxygenase HmoA